jgi:hypothetical protein
MNTMQLFQIGDLWFVSEAECLLVKHFPGEQWDLLSPTYDHTSPFFSKDLKGPYLCQEDAAAAAKGRRSKSNVNKR